MKSHRNKIAFIIVLVLIILVGFRIRERMLYNPIRGLYLAGKHREYDTLGCVEGLKMHYRDRREDPEPEEYLLGTYEPEYLKEKYEVYLTFEKNDFSIDAFYELSQWYNILLTFSYNPKTNTLLYEPLLIINLSESEGGEPLVKEEAVRGCLAQYGITDDEIHDMQSYILYDVVIKSWEWRYGVEPLEKDRGIDKLKIEDHTFDFEE